MEQGTLDQPTKSRSIPQGLVVDVALRLGGAETLEVAAEGKKHTERMLMAEGGPTGEFQSFDNQNTEGSGDERKLELGACLERKDVRRS